MSIFRSLTCSATDLRQALKAAQAFRTKTPTAYGSPDETCYITANPGGLSIELFNFAAGGASFYAWLPASCEGSGAFSLPLTAVLAFVTATKGKGAITYRSDTATLSSSVSGGALQLTPGPSAPPEESALSVREFASQDLDSTAEGFPLFPFLRAAPFTSTGEAKPVLEGVSFEETATRSPVLFATCGHMLRRVPTAAPAWPSAATYPAHLWLPRWLAAVITAATQPKEREGLLAFYCSQHNGSKAPALRFVCRSGVTIALRFAPIPGTFPRCAQLIADLPLSLSVNREHLLAAVESLSTFLKGSNSNNPLIDMLFDAEVDQIKLSATVKDVGAQEVICRATYRAANLLPDPQLSEGYEELKPLDREALQKAYTDQRTVVFNAAYLLKVVKSFEREGDNLTIYWSSSSTPVQFLSALPDSFALIMPVVRRKGK